MFDLTPFRYGASWDGDRADGEIFDFGGKRFDALLAGVGAKRIGKRM